MFPTRCVSWRGGARKFALAGSIVLALVLSVAAAPRYGFDDIGEDVVNLEALDRPLLLAAPSTATEPGRNASRQDPVDGDGPRPAPPLGQTPRP